MTQRRNVLPWIVWGAGIFAYAVAIINRSSLASLGPAAQTHYGVEATGLSIFVFVQLLVYGGMQIPVGILMTKFGIHPVMIAGLVLMAAGQLFMAFAPELWMAVLARALVGVGDAGIFICAIRLVANWFTPRYLPVMSQLTGLAGQLGQLVSVTPLAIYVGLAGWNAGFYALASVSMLAAVVGFAVLRDRPGETSALERVFGFKSRATQKSQPLTEETLEAQAGFAPVTEALPVLGPGGSGVFAAIRSLWQRPGIRLAYWTHFTTPFSLHIFLLLWGTPFLIGGMGLTRAQAGIVLSTTVFSTMVGGLVLGPITSRWSRHRVWIAVWIVIGMMVSWAVTLLWPGQAPLWWLLILAVTLALGGPASMIAFDIVRTHAHEHQAAVATGLSNSGGFTGAMIAVLAVGVLLDVQGAGSPETYSADAFKIAMSAQFPLWILGVTMILRNLPKARAAVQRRKLT